MAEGQSAAAADNLRNDWFAQRVAHALHIKPDKFSKMMEKSEEGARPMVEFLVNPLFGKLSDQHGRRWVCFAKFCWIENRRIIRFHSSKLWDDFGAPAVDSAQPPAQAFVVGVF